MVYQIKRQSMFPHLSLKSTGRPERFSFCEGSWSLKQVACSAALSAHSLITRPLLTTFLRAHKCAHQHTNVHKCTQICPHVHTQKWTPAQQICTRLLHFLCAGNKQCMHVQPFTSVEHKACTFGQTQQILLRQDNDNLFIQGLVDPVQPAHKSEKNMRHLFWNYELFSPTQSVTMPIIIESLWMIKKYP